MRDTRSIRLKRALKPLNITHDIFILIAKVYQANEPMAAVAFVSIIFLVAHLDSRRQKRHLRRNAKDIFDVYPEDNCSSSDMRQDFTNLTESGAKTVYPTPNCYTSTTTRGPELSVIARLGALRNTISGK